jgi:hypothetical protein
MHSLPLFTERFFGFVKNAGPSGPTGPSRGKTFKSNHKSGTTPVDAVGPVDAEWSQPAATSGPANIVSDQRLAVPVTTGTSGTTSVAGASTPSQSSEALSDWHAYADYLQGRMAPEWMSEGRWCQVVSDTKTFLAAWGVRAHAQGWRLIDLLGVHPIAPAARVGVQGLMFFVRGGAVIGVSGTSATFRRLSGSTLTFERIGRDEAVLVGGSHDDK